MCLVGLSYPSVVMRLTRVFRALSRSAQYWSSYSGYLREVCTYRQIRELVILAHINIAQLCFAFQRWNDIGLAFAIEDICLLKMTLLDTAKEIHHNTTVESIAVLRYLSEREKRMQEAREESDAILEVGFDSTESTMSCSTRRAGYSRHFGPTPHFGHGHRYCI